MEIIMFALIPIGCIAIYGVVKAIEYYSEKYVLDKIRKSKNKYLRYWRK